MPEIDAQSLVDQAVLVGLVSRSQAREAMDDAEDGTTGAIARAMMRKGYITSWQRDKLVKGDPNGYFFGGCKVLFHLAEGTFARVYRGERDHGGQSVAIKVLRRRFTTDPASVARFNQEAEAGLKLIHPNIVRILEYGEQDKNYYMIMEYVEGSNLRDFLKIRQRLNATDALPLMIGLAQGLKYSLDHGTTHRDIKATNILIGSKGVAKLVDFGLATINLDDFTAGNAHGMRTVDYSALERTCGTFKGDPRSDIYFLGCVFYQMITGSPAMAETETSDPLAKMLKRSFGAIKPLHEHRLAPPPELTRIIEKMMKIDLKQRYKDMDLVVEELLAYEASQGEPQAAKAVAKPKAPKPANQTDAFASAFEREFGHLADNPIEPKNLLCVEVQEPIQDAFRKVFSQMGFKVILVGDAERAAERYRETPPDVVVFDADGLGPNAIESFLDMHEKAREDGHELAALVLLGPRQAALSEQLPTDDRLVVLNKPLKMKDVQDAITQLASP